MSELVLFTNSMSRGNTVDLLLKILDVPYKRIELGYGADMHTAEYLAINPMAKVPALVDGDAVVTETAAICLYLADKFIEKGLAPALNDPKRADYYRWFLFTAGPIESAFTINNLGIQLDEEQQKSSGFGSVERTMACLEIGLNNAKPFICGEQFTAVDVYVGAFVMFLVKYQIMETTPAMQKYLDSLAAIPAIAELLAK
ncbi:MULTISPECIES: glutathione S-transferase family protein [Providencia]|uniref:Glutathione S-transferase family protein n=1 Tax=Providencia rettgeri TaxID=587 RepID=A0A264VYF2_PRORE|nr:MULTISPECIES: glutathione S-transferase family protein [Providencia]EFE52740.1 glutathione S-transferase, N-terminal domain protein [Providencia rettgeri DSM 1131]EHZ6871596.1 glutathione S-transferase family protein [Providencia rettgeri]MBJ9971226.1 glutathione S-transferase family protein [Providencia rettgeri]MCF8962700.1 Disulfide-bond oxidoreductase YfcG [Providencia rettgeri]MDB9567042.1 glutathione S-transferase family protein [Providencia rettgeri]